MFALHSFSSGALWLLLVSVGTSAAFCSELTLAEITDINRFAGAPLDECLKKLEELPAEETAAKLHDLTLQQPAKYRRESGYVEMLRLLGLRASVEQNEGLRAAIIAEVEQRLRSVLLFERHGSYVDNMADGSIKLWVPEGNVKYRGARSIALRLEALRAMEDLTSIEQREVSLSNDELAKLIHRYNPTHVASTRNDPALKGRTEWSIAERGQVALFASLLHFPEDQEAITLLVSASEDRRSTVVWTEGVLAVAVPFFVYHLMSAPEGERTIVAKLMADPTPFAAHEYLSKDTGLSRLTGIFAGLVHDARAGSLRYVPTGTPEPPLYQDVTRALSKARQEAIYGTGYVLRLMSVNRERVRIKPSMPLLKETVYVRDNWHKHWNLPTEDPQAEEELRKRIAFLNGLATDWLRLLEESVPSLLLRPTLEDKAMLIAELIRCYEGISPTVSDPEFDRSITRLGKIFGGLDEGSLISVMRENALWWTLYDRYHDPQTKAVDVLLIKRIAKNPPADIRKKAFERYELQMDILSRHLDRLLMPLYRDRPRWSLMRRLGFSVSTIHELQKSAEQRRMEGEEERIE